MRKPVMPRDKVQRVTWERDYDHEAWLDGTATEPLTRATHPDAFYRVTQPAWPAPAAPVTRKPRHKTLSRTQLRKRLSRAGLSGGELRRVLNLIKAGPGLAQLANGGASRMALGWDVKHLADTIGVQLTRKVLRFVQTIFIVRDEYWDLVMPGLEMLFAQARSYSSQRHVEVQDATAAKLDAALA